MKNQTYVKKLSLSGMFLAISFLLPFLTGQIPRIGAMLCPMHLPVLLCGYVCGGYWGMAVGAIAPILRSVALGAPPFLTAMAMVFELAVYGLLSGLLYRALPKRKRSIYLSLVIAMLGGRLIWGGVRFLMMGLGVSGFTLGAFWAGAVVNALPGIILQLVLIPVIVIALEKLK